jgi:hypothetical protein
MEIRIEYQAYCRSVVHVEMCFLDTLTMVTLWIGQAEETLLKEVAELPLATNKFRRQESHLLFAVPERKSNILQTVCVGNTGNTIFTPSVGSRPSIIIGQITPGVAICTVILSY